MGIDRRQYLDQDEVKRLRTVCEAWCVLDLQAGRKRGPLLWCVVDTALLTGLRVSELARLTCGDFDAKRGALKVWRHKRKKPLRETMALPPNLVQHLKEFLAWKETVGQPVGKSDALFHGKRGPLTTAGLARLWKVAVVRAGLPTELSIHSARHTCATHLLRKTRNLRQCQKQLGHSSPVVTANLYSDVAFEDMRDGLDGLYDDA